MFNCKYQKMTALMLLSLSTGIGSVFAQSAPAAQTQAPATQSNPNSNGTQIDPSGGTQSPEVQPQPASTTAPTSTLEVAPNSQQTQTQPVQPAASPQTAPPPANPGATPNTAPQQTTPQQTTPPRTETPVGAATAERGRTLGGVASRPAGVAIAPAKQHQVRSILIKTGAVVAGAVAVGTIYALHRSTGSNPPGAASGAKQ